MDGSIRSVNVGAAERNRFKRGGSTGFAKVPVAGPVAVRAPGPAGGTSGLAGDFIGDRRHHGGDTQAVYAFAREDLDRWEGVLGRDLPDGAFAENLTTTGIDVNAALVGERWRVGDTLELVVTSPRIACSTFRGWLGETGWLKTFTADARPGAYFSVAVPGEVRAGDAISVVRRPEHDVSVALVFRAITTERELLPRLAAAGSDLVPELAAAVSAATGQAVGTQ